MNIPDQMIEECLKADTDEAAFVATNLIPKDANYPTLLICVMNGTAVRLISEIADVAAKTAESNGDVELAIQYRKTGASLAEAFALPSATHVQ